MTCESSLLFKQFQIKFNSEFNFMLFSDKLLPSYKVRTAICCFNNALVHLSLSWQSSRTLQKSGGTWNEIQAQKTSLVDNSSTKMGEIQPEKNLLFDCIFYLVNKPLLEAISHILLD